MLYWERVWSQLTVCYHNNHSFLHHCSTESHLQGLFNPFYPPPCLCFFFFFLGEHSVSYLHPCTSWPLFLLLRWLCNAVLHCAVAQLAHSRARRADELSRCGEMELGWFWVTVKILGDTRNIHIERRWIEDYTGKEVKGNHQIMKADYLL